MNKHEAKLQETKVKYSSHDIMTLLYYVKYIQISDLIFNWKEKKMWESG